MAKDKHSRPSPSVSFLEGEIAECDTITLELQMQKKSMENEINNLMAQAKQKIANVTAQIEQVKQKRVGYAAAIKALSAQQPPSPAEPVTG